MNDLNALIGIDFSLIGTKLRAVYEKKGEDGYAILLAPSAQEADNGVSIGKVIDDIKKLVSSAGSGASTADMEKDLTEGISALTKGDGKTGSDTDKFDLNKIMVQLNMAYLYLCKDKEQDVLEYVFQLRILTEGLIPPAIAEIVDVSGVSLSIWNTSRQKVVNQMQLITIDNFLE